LHNSAQLYINISKMSRKKRNLDAPAYR